jgi:hydroxymethylpyrimidine/phosphomethylpyrimidine kinase
VTEAGDRRGQGPARPDVLICAGLDPSGGAGLIADVRVVSELGGRQVYGRHVGRFTRCQRADASLESQGARRVHRERACHFVKRGWNGKHGPLFGEENRL